MTPTEQARMVADFMGYWIAPQGEIQLHVPDFPNDLNAIANVEAEIKRRGLRGEYLGHLEGLVTIQVANDLSNDIVAYGWACATATAAQRLAACVRVIEQMEGK